MGELAIEQQAEPVAMAEIGSFAGGLEFGKSLSQTRKPELARLSSVGWVRTFTSSVVVA